MVAPISPTSLLGEIAGLPGATKILHRHRLDFCCGGHRNLSDACKDAGLDPRAILEEIDDAEEADDAKPTPPDGIPALVDHIVEHYHVPGKRALPELIRMAMKVRIAHVEHPRCPRGIVEHLAMMFEAIADHLAKEETILFPLLKSGGHLQAGGPIHCMEEEHDQHGANLAHLRMICDDFRVPEGACATWWQLYRDLEEFEAELMEHVHLENNVLFPRVRREAEG